MASSINAIDRMMATRGSKANEEAEEKKRARASPHKAPPPDPKKGRSSPNSLGENHNEEAIEAQPMSVDEPQFSDDPDEGPEEAEATITSSLEGIDIAKNKGTTAEETTAQPNCSKKNKKLAFEDETAKEEELIEDEDVYEIWLLPVDKEARNKVDRAKVTNALTTELKAMYNLDQNNAEKLIINLSAQEVRGATNTFSILCLTAEVEVDIRLSLEETALKVEDRGGGNYPLQGDTLTEVDKHTNRQSEARGDRRRDHRLLGRYQATNPSFTLLYGVRPQ